MPKPDPRTTPFAHADMLDGRDLQARLRYLLSEDGYLMTDTAMNDRTWLMEVSAAFDKPLEAFVFVSWTYMPTYARQAAEHKHGREMMESWPFASIDWELAADEYVKDHKLKEIEMGGKFYYAIS